MRKELGLATTVVALSHAISSFYSSERISTDIVKFKQEFKKEFEKSLIQREKLFLKKRDLDPFLIQLKQMHQQLVILNQRVEEFSLLDYTPSSELSEQDCSGILVKHDPSPHL